MLSHGEKLARDIRWGLGVIVTIAVIKTIFGWGTDATDYSADLRSGIKLYTDYGTGCQYVGGTFAITPRMNGAGKQEGCR